MDNTLSTTRMPMQNLDDNIEDQRLNDGQLHFKASSRQQVQRRQERWRIGLILLSVVIVLWVASGFLINVSSTLKVYY